MGTGILICGLNGAGKTTLGKALADKLRIPFIDHEDLCFPKLDPNRLYASPRTEAEAQKLLLQEIKVQERFVFASVNGVWGNDVQPFLTSSCWSTCQGISVCGGSRTGRFSSSVPACCRAEICTNKSSVFSASFDPVQSI